MSGTVRSVAVALLLSGLAACVPAARANAAPRHPCAVSGSQTGDPATTVPWDAALRRGTEPGTVSGAVYDVTGTPVPAMIAIQSAEGGAGVMVLADTAGAFRVEGLAPGRHELEVQWAGYLGQVHELQLLPGGSERVCIVLRALSMMFPDIGG